MYYHAGVAVGCGWQALVAYINVGCYYIIGIPVGCLLGFKFGFGVKVSLLIIWILNIYIKFIKNKLIKL
jgi:Na+-driven multidrug efflux pump